MGLYQDVREDSSGNVYINLQDGSANGITSTALPGSIQALDVYMQGGTVSVTVPDQTAYVYGASGFLPVGGVYQDAGATLSAGESGAFRLTAERAVHMNLRDSSGNELGDANANGLWVKPGDGTNTQEYSGTNEAYVAIRDSGNVAAVNASNELLVKDTDVETVLTSIDGKLSPASAALTQVTLSDSSQTALASNASRKGFIMVNASNRSAYVAFSATATTSAFTYLIRPNSTIEPNFGAYTGVISVISETGVSGELVITELS